MRELFAFSRQHTMVENTNDPVSFVHASGDRAEPHPSPRPLERGSQWKVERWCISLAQHSTLSFPFLCTPFPNTVWFQNLPPPPLEHHCYLKDKPMVGPCFWNLLSVTSRRSSYSWEYWTQRRKVGLIEPRLWGYCEIKYYWDYCETVDGKYRAQCLACRRCSINVTHNILPSPWRVKSFVFCQRKSLSTGSSS